MIVTVCSHYAIRKLLETLEYSFSPAEFRGKLVEYIDPQSNLNLDVSR